MRGSREISLVPSLHRASTDALIYIDQVASTGIFQHCNVVCNNKQTKWNKVLVNRNFAAVLRFMLAGHRNML